MKRLLLFLLMLMFCLPVCAEQQTTILGHMPDDEYIHQYVAPNGQLLWFTAIEKNPYISRSYQLRGLCRANLDSLALAESDIRTAIKHDPQNINMWQNLAGVVMQAGEWERAAAVVDSMLVFAPRNSDAYVMRTQVAMNLKDTLTALAMADKAVALDKYSANVYDARSMVHYAMGAYEEAEADISKSIDLLPGRSNSYANRGLIRYYREDLRGALADFDMAVYADSTSLTARYNRGLLLMEFGDNNKAIKDFDMVLGVDPDNTLARFNRALLRTAVGDYKGAEGDFSVVIEAYPNFEQAYSCRAEARRKLGDAKGAKADEAWLFNRRQEIYFYGVESVQKEYSADADSTRRRSDENVRNYNKMIVPVDENAKQYVAEARGKVQNRNVYVELEPLFVLTCYCDESAFAGDGYNKLLEELNAGRVGCRMLILTNRERALTGAEADYHFAHIDDVSSTISVSEDNAMPYRERALDYFLLQDIEAAMSDVDNAVEAAPGDWSVYFIRAFVRYKQLEIERLNGVEPQDSKQNALLADLDYRLVKEDLDRVIELQPEFVEAYFNRANVSAKLNDFKSAIVDYTKAISLNDRFAQAYYNRGLAKIYTGNTEGGVTDLSKAGELGMYQAYSVIRRFR
jgi:tetratricopeptide (TPR) repeat protein